MKCKIECTEEDVGAEEAEAAVDGNNEADDEQVREAVSETFPAGALPKARLYNGMTVEHAYIPLKELITALLAHIFTTPFCKGISFGFWTATL